MAENKKVDYIIMKPYHEYLIETLVKRCEEHISWQPIDLIHVF